MADKAALAAPFLGTLDDTAPMIERLRVELDENAKHQMALNEKANDLASKIAALNTLRSAHGLGPL